MTSGGKVLVVGDVMTDVIVVPEGPLVRGSDRRAEIRSRAGGSGANQAVWLGAMGANVHFAARIGAADKARLDTYFAGFGIVPHLAVDDALPSGVLVTIVDPDGERSFLTDRGANLALSETDLPESLLDGTSFVVVSGYSFFAEGPRVAVRALFARAQARSISVAVDPASVGFLQEVGVGNFLNWTEGADILFANGDEALALSGFADLDQQMKTLGARFGRVVIKCGGNGAVLGDINGIRLTLPAPSVSVVDTTGAGDAFAAGFLSAEINGLGEAEALAAGIAAGSRAVQWVGGQPQTA